MDEHIKTITVERPTGPRIAPEQPVSVGQLVVSKSKSVAKSVGAVAALSIAVLAKYKWAISGSAIMAVTTHLIVASTMMGMIGDKKPAPPASYTGPGDVQSGGIAFWSCRAFSQAKAGTKAYRLIRASDSTQTDINSLASGLCDTSTPTTFCTSTTCKYVTWYDQSGAGACSGACDLTQSTDADRFVWQASVKNGWPCAASTRTSTQEMTTPSVGTALTTFGFLTMGERTGSTSLQSNAIAGVGTGFGAGIFWSAATNSISAFNGGTITDNTHSADSVFHNIIGSFSNGSGSQFIQIDGNTAVTGAAGGNGVSGLLSLGDNGAVGLDGFFCEAGVWNVFMTTTQAGSVNSNVHDASFGWNF